MGALLDPIAWSLVAPLGAACLVFVAAGRARTALCLVAPPLVALAAAGLVAQVSAHGPRTLALGGWPAPPGIALAADGLSAFFVAVTAGVGLLVSVYALSYLPRQRESDRDMTAFWPLWLFCWLGLNGVYLSADLFNLYVALEVLGLSAVALVALAGGAALVAGIRYALVTLLGSLCFLLGVALLYAEYGVVDLALIGQVAEPGPATWAALVLMTLGLALKTALFPLHGWLPPAHAGALAPASAILSALVVKASFYLLLRLWTAALPAVATAALAWIVGALGVAAIVWGSVLAVRQTHLKMLVAYSTVAQVGYLLLIVPLVLDAPSDAAAAAAWQGGLYFVATHACAKSAMFLAAGTVRHAFGGDAIVELRGLSVRAPLTMMTFGISGVTLIGLPPTGGFLAKWMLLLSAFEGGRWPIAVAIVAGTLLAAAYVLPPIARSLRDPPEGQWRRARIPLGLELPAFALALAGLLLGLLARAPLRLLELGRPLSAAVGVDGGS